MSIRTSSHHLLSLKEREGKTISIGELIRHFNEQSFSIIIMLFALPVALPIPTVGISTFIAIPILILSSQLLIGRRVMWLPDKIAHRELDMESLRRVVDFAVGSKWLRRMEIFIKPRLLFLSGKIGHQIAGAVILICSISVALPIPLGNMIPSIGIVIICMGLLERDGILIFAGICVGLGGIIFVMMVYYFGYEAVKTWFETINIFNL